MVKIIFSLVFFLSVLFGSTHKGGGCELSQVGDVSLSLQGYGSYDKAKYQAIAKSGKNFKTIFIGSVIEVDGVTLEILDIQANKRIKGKPRTGTIEVRLKTADKNEIINMKYSYNKGKFDASGKLHSGEKISFTLHIKAILCSSK